MTTPFHLYIPHALLNQSHGSLYGVLEQDRAYVTKLRQCQNCPPNTSAEVYLGEWLREENGQNGMVGVHRVIVTLHGPCGEYPSVRYHRQPDRPLIVIVYNAGKVMAVTFDDESVFVYPLAETLRTIVKTDEQSCDNSCHRPIIQKLVEEGIFDKFSAKMVAVISGCDNFDAGHQFLTKITSKCRRIFHLSYTLSHFSLIYRQAKLFATSTSENKKNFASRILLNFLIGLLVFYVITKYSLYEIFASTAMEEAQYVAEQISQLLGWIMDVPAGLKLNKQLTNLLGNFFSYHIYLWQGYLYFLKPYLSSVIFYGSLTGILGFTFQIGFALDLMAMMSVHIHCFYFYAVRLYSFQLYALLSLWNLFRGKKYNVLRKRVDSLAYDARQLFIGTLLFACLFFLFPTTLVYYVCFTVLRLSVISIQGVLYRSSLLLNRIPVYKTFLILTGSDEICVHLSFCTICTSRGDDRPLFLAMDLTPLSVGELTLDNLESCTDERSISWSEFAKKLLVGELVYPWITISE